KKGTKCGINLIRHGHSLHFCNTFSRRQDFIIGNGRIETISLCQETNLWIFVENLLPACCHGSDEQEHCRDNCHPDIFLFFHLEQNDGTENERHRSQNLVTNTEEWP